MIVQGGTELGWRRETERVGKEGRGRGKGRSRRQGAWSLKLKDITPWPSSVTGSLHTLSDLILTIIVWYRHNKPMLQNRKVRHREVKSMILVTQVLSDRSGLWTWLLWFPNLLSSHSLDVSGPRLRHAQNTGHSVLCKDSQWSPSPLKV